MAKATPSIFSQLEVAVLNEDQPLAGALRKVVLLAGKTRSEELRSWATKELEGYERDEKLPSYRVFPAAIHFDGQVGPDLVTNERINFIDLPAEARNMISEEVDLRYGVAELEAIVAHAEADHGFFSVEPRCSAEIARLMFIDDNETYRTVDSVYWSVNAVSIRGLLDRVRTKLAQLVSELHSADSDDEGEPSPEAVQQAANFIIGGRARVKNLNALQAANKSRVVAGPAASEEDDSPGWSTTKKVCVFLVGLAGILTAIGTIALWAPWN